MCVIVIVASALSEMELVNSVVPEIVAVLEIVRLFDEVGVDVLVSVAVLEIVMLDEEEDEEVPVSVESGVLEADAM